MEAGTFHDLGECEVKHGARIPVVNLCGPEFGNAQVPEKILRDAKAVDRR